MKITTDISKMSRVTEVNIKKDSKQLQLNLRSQGMIHEELIRVTITALENLFNDTSVSQNTTRDDLEDIINHIDNMIDTLSP